MKSKFKILEPRKLNKYDSHAQLESPFFGISYGYRKLILILFLVYFFMNALRFFFSVDSEPKIAALAKTIELFISFLPVLFYQASFGWLHPLIFPVLFELLQDFPALINDCINLISSGPSEIIYPIKFITATGAWSPNQLSLLLAYKSLLVSIALFFYYIGFFFVASPRVPEIKFNNPKNLQAKIIPLILLTFSLFFIYIYIKGGLTAYLLSWSDEGRSKAIGDYGPLVGLIRMGPFLCLLWFALESKASLKPIFWICTISSLIIDFLTSGSRSVVIMTLGSLLLIWMLINKKIPSKRIIVFILFCVLIVGLLGNFRRDLTHNGKLDWNHIIDFQSGLNASIGSSSEEGEFKKRSTETDGALPILALVPDKYELLYGQSYWTIVTAMIPRDLWPNKPPSIGSLTAAKFFNLPNGGIPPGAVAEAYWNFHIPGVMFVFFLFGVFHRWLAKFFRKYCHHSAALVIYLILIWRLQPDSLSIFKTVYIIGPLLIIMWFLGSIKLRVK